MAGKEREHGDEAEQGRGGKKRKEEENKKRPLCLQNMKISNGAVIFLVKFSRFAHRPSSPVILSGVNNRPHLVGLTKRRETGRKKEGRDSVLCSKRLLNLYLFTQCGRGKAASPTFPFLIFSPSFCHYLTCLHMQKRI